MISIIHCFITFDYEMHFTTVLLTWVEFVFVSLILHS